MTRQEFSAEITKLRVTDNCSKNELMRRSGMTLLVINRIENAVNNYSVKNAMTLIAKVNGYISLVCDKRVIICKKYDDIFKAIKDVRVEQKMTQAELSKASGVSRSP